MIDDLIRQWGRDKKINNPDKQTVKLMEEVGELAHEICRGRYKSDELIDAFGDIQVVLIILADMLDIDLESCKTIAYDVIRERKGVTKDGCFVKGNE